MRTIDVSGTAYERGFQQGQAFRGEFDEMMRTFFGSELWRENKPWFVPDRVIKGALAGLGRTLTREAVQRTLPVQAERVRGLARGLGISEWLAWGVQFLEIVFCEAGSSLVPPVPGGCTQLHVQPKASAAGGAFLARNYDFPNILQPYQVVRREQPSEAGRYATLFVGQTAIAGAHQGMNERGLAAAANNARLPRGDDLRYGGVPYELILVEILETCASVAEAVDAITRIPNRGNAGFLGLVDESGDSAIVEFTAVRTLVRRPDEVGVMAQANHFVRMTEANLPDGTMWNVKGMEGVEFAVTSGRRYEVADERLRAEAGRLNVESLKAILRDHSANDGVGADHTVCMHGRSGSTLASIILDIHAREAWIADGAPCLTDYTRIEFQRSEAKVAAG